ncbi:TRI59 protein, partial [Pycnonotus jocosus]|nr:TRI59 protein [Pycnonotus jocosus]
MERLEEELTCAICCEIFSDPRVLPCSHTFCRPCLQNLLRSPHGLPAGRRLSCPSCRALVAVPAAGPEALPINFALKAVIEKCQQQQQQEEEEAAGAEAGTCRAHPRQPLNIYCLQERQLVCGQCLTIGKHRGHPIDDLQSAYRKGREALGQLLEELTDQSRSKASLCSEGLRQHKARCQDDLQIGREAVLRYFKQIGNSLEKQKKTLLSSLDELEGRISEKYDPLIEEVEKLKLEESELKELYSAVQKEESPLLFLEKLDGLQLRLQALRQKQLPEPDPVEIHPRIQNVLGSTWDKTELRQVYKIEIPKLHLVPKGQRFGNQISAAALWAALTDPTLFLGILLLLVVMLLSILIEGTIPAPLVYLWQFLQWISPDCCSHLQDTVQELCH